MAPWPKPVTTPVKLTTSARQPANNRDFVVRDQGILAFLRRTESLVVYGTPKNRAIKQISKAATENCKFPHEKLLPLREPKNHGSTISYRRLPLRDSSPKPIHGCRPSCDERAVTPSEIRNGTK